MEEEGPTSQGEEEGAASQGAARHLQGPSAVREIHSQALHHYLQEPKDMDSFHPSRVKAMFSIKT